MKKLMIAAAIVCAAAVSQAATAEWNTGVMYYGGDKSAVGDDTKTMVADGNWGYLWILGTDATAAADYAALTTSKAIWEAAVLDNSDYTTSTLTVNGRTYYSTDTYQTEGGQVGFQDMGEYTPGDTVYGIVIATLEDADELVAYAANGFTADVKTAGVQNSAAALQWGAEGSGVATTWTATAVPEPTSGLLLLLGVAGLALRRRRA